MDIKISKSDYAWSYLAQFFNIATGIITLPVILKLLSVEEVGFNYILVSINSIVVLFDMGFSGQFSRYLTYIFSGAQKIKKEGLAEEYGETINVHLLACTIKTAKLIYFVISIIALLFLVSLGTLYVYDVTEHFTLIPNALFIWLIFAISSFFNIFYLYLNAFLQGRGLVKETKQAQVFSKVCQILITFLMLFAGCGLLSVVIANLISPFVFRFFAYKKFYTRELKQLISFQYVNNSEIREIFSVLFHNAKKIGIIGILSSAIGYASTLLIGKYLSLADVGSYGLLVQLTGIVITVATTHFNSSVPTIASIMVSRDSNGIRRQFGISMFFFYGISIMGFIAMMVAPIMLNAFNVNTQLPIYPILVSYYFYKICEQNQSLFSQLFLLENDFRFFPSAVWTGTISFCTLWISLLFGCGIFGVVVAQMVPLLAFVAWKWPIEAINKYQINPTLDFFITPYIQIKKIIHERFF